MTSDAPATDDAGPLDPTDPAPPPVRRRSFLFEAARLASANFFTSFIQVCIGIATVRIWGAAARGSIETAIALPTLLSIVFDLGLGRAMPYTIGRKLASLSDTVSTAMIMWIVASVIGVTTCVIYAVTQLADQLDSFWIALAIAYFPLRLFAGIVLGFCVGIERIDFFAKLMSVREPTALFILLALAAIPMFRQPEDAWIRLFSIDFVVAFTAVLGLIFITRHARISLRINRKLLREMTHRSVTFGLGPLFLDLLQNTPSMLLTLSIFAVPKANIGNYTVGAAVAMLLMQLAYAVGHVLMSRSVNTEDREAQTRKTLRLLRVGVTGAAVLGAGMMLTAPILIPLAYKRSEVPDAPWITICLVPGIVGFFALHTLSTDLIARGRALTVAAVTASALVANLSTCALYSIPHHGIYGAAITTASWYIITAGVMLVVYTRITGASLRDAVTPRPGDFPIEQVRNQIRARLRRRD